MFSDEQPSQPQNQPPSKSSHLWKWVGIGCGGILLLLIIGTGAILYFAQQVLNISVSPEQAEEQARNIMDYDIPGGSQGLLSMEINGFQVVGVTSANDPQQIMLMLGQAPYDFPGDPAQLQDALQQGLEQQTGGFDFSSERRQPMQLCGETVDVNILTGEYSVFGQNSVPALSYQTFVLRDDKTIIVALTTTGDQAETTAEQVFNSLDCQ